MRGADVAVLGGGGTIGPRMTGVAAGTTAGAGVETVVVERRLVGRRTGSGSGSSTVSRRCGITGNTGLPVAPNRGSGGGGGPNGFQLPAGKPPVTV